MISKIRNLINVCISALNDKEIIGQALIFLLAGYETVSTLLSFFFYVMATQPEIQEKVYDEIQQEIGNVCHK
jgi:cytochrome P450 family 3 subfamily A